MSLEIAKEGRKFNMSQVTDFDLQRKMSDLLFVGMAILPQNELKRFEILPKRSAFDLIHYSS